MLLWHRNYCLVLPFLGLTQGSPSVRSSRLSVLSSLLADTPLSICRSASTPSARAHRLPPTLPRKWLGSALLEDCLAEAVIGPAWWSWSSTERKKLQICSQLNRGPENPQRGIALVPFCIVCLVAASFVFASGCLSWVWLFLLPCWGRGPSSNDGASLHLVSPLLLLVASSQSGPLRVRSPSCCLHLQKISSGD